MLIGLDTELIVIFETVPCTINRVNNIELRCHHGDTFTQLLDLAFYCSITYNAAICVYSFHDDFTTENTTRFTDKQL